MAISLSQLTYLVLLLVAVALPPSFSLPQGPPVDEHFDRVCREMAPLHGSNDATPGNGGFFIQTDLPRDGYRGFYNYTAGQTYTIIVNGTESTFRGFLVIAHVPGEDNMLLGSFTPQNKSQQTLNCSFTGATNEMTSTIAHNNSDRIDFESIAMKWTAPEDQDGMVDFRFTIVHNFTTFYVRQRASLNGLSTPTKEPGKYRLTFRDPPNCQVSSCDVFVGIDTNAGDSDYLNIYLEGEADGWVAVGFTETPSMFSSIVVACNRNPDTDVVEALDTYNLPQPRRANEVASNPEVVPFSGNYSDGRIQCSVAKKIAATNDTSAPVNINLNSDLYILYGRRTGDSGTGVLFRHEKNPTISARRHNPVTDGARGDGDNFPQIPLIRAHGALMLIAWPLLGVCGIFFASWMRQALPKGRWFKVHVTLMLASLFIGVVGVALVFIAHAHKDNPRGLISLGSENPVGTAHFAFGILIVLLQLINPILAVFRCKPDHRRRWIFNVVHGLSIGLGAQTLAFVNVGLGAYLFNDGVSSIFWVYIGYVIFMAVLFALLYLIFTVSTLLNKKEGTSLAPSLLKPLFKLVLPSGYSPLSPSETVKVRYSGMDESQAITTEKVDLMDKDKSIAYTSKDYLIRWISLVVYLVVSTPLVVAMVFLTATSSVSG